MTKRYKLIVTEKLSRSDPKNKHYSLSIYEGIQIIYKSNHRDLISLCDSIIESSKIYGKNLTIKNDNLRGIKDFDFIKEIISLAR